MKIIILGAQRSGTNIAAAIAAHDNKLPLHSERDIGYSSCSLTHGEKEDLIEWINSNDDFVLQAPSLNCYAHKLIKWIKKPFVIHWVHRNPNDIRISRERVGWFGEEKESKKYNEVFGEMMKHWYCKDSVDMCQRVWKEYQSKVVSHIHINYEDLKTHELWKTEREALRIGDT